METIAACMICRNGETTIEAAVNSAREHVDEVNVYLAGESVDRTPAVLAELASQPGAPIRVEKGEWRGDYGWAKNQSFEMASPGIEWLLTLDDDEELQGGWRLGRELSDDADALFVRKYDYRTPDELLRKWTVRVVRRDAGCRWVGTVHEQLEGDDDLRWRVVHPGSVVSGRAPLRAAGHSWAAPLLRCDACRVCENRQPPSCRATCWRRVHSRSPRRG
jgi:glycosyltransferase involved in cell wall biosynthesis